MINRHEVSNLYKLVLVRSYMIWVWLFKHPDKVFGEHVLARMLKLDNLCPVFLTRAERDSGSKICEVICPFRLLDYKYKQEYCGTFLLSMLLTSEKEWRGYQLEGILVLIKKHSIKSMRAHLAMTLRRVIRAEYPESEVLDVY